MGPNTCLRQFVSACKRGISWLRTKLPWTKPHPVPVAAEPMFPKHWWGRQRPLSVWQRQEKKRRHLRKIARYARKGKRLPVRGWRIAA